ncbi:MAG: hypothetical protein IAI50_17970 [Candidatus Eremiobacteraeota bacterium]|nr:hypothetical protein [Candidatus Eremiobacteraeota bacterium]
MMAAFTILVLGAARNVALFGLVAFPCVAAALTRSLTWFSASERSEPAPPVRREATFGLAVAAAAAAFAVGVQTVRLAPTAPDLAAKPLAALVRKPGPHRLFCADFGWCGRAVGLANVRVFLDGRADPYPRGVWDDYITIARVGTAWRTTLERRGVDAVIVTRDAALDQALAMTPGWHAGYSDRAYRLWLKPRGGEL